MKRFLFKSKSFRWGLLSLLVLSLLIVFSAQTAKADIKATAAFYTWDRADGQFKNSNVALLLDPDWWVPMIHELGNDKDLYVNACPDTGGGTDTDWAGELTMGLGYLDTTGGHGFQNSDNWTLVHCDRNDDGNFDNTDLSVPVVEGADLYGFIEWSEVSTKTFQIIASDVITSCSNNTCATEMITTMFINLDDDCDGDLSDENIPLGGVCFYAEAQPPSVSMQPYWQGNLQARISAGGGDKTVNHSVAGPNAVTMAKFSAMSQSLDINWVIGLLAVILLFGLGSFFLIRRKRNFVTIRRWDDDH